MRHRVPTLLSDLQVPPHPKSYSADLMHPSHLSLILGHHRDRRQDHVCFQFPCFTLSRVSFPPMLDQTNIMVPPFSKPTLVIKIMPALPRKT